MKRKSLSVIRNLDLSLRAYSKAQDYLYCWRMKEMGVEYSEEQRKKIEEAAQVADRAEKIAREVFQEVLGKLIVDEVAQGSWR